MKRYADGKVATPPLSLAVKMWPTPTTQMARPDMNRVNRERSGGDDLGTKVLKVMQSWPTPKFGGITGGTGSWELLKKNTTLEEARKMGAGNGGKLNPDWVDALMGFPVGLTSTAPLNADDFQEWVCGFSRSLHKNAPDCQTSKYGAHAWRLGTWEQDIPRVVEKQEGRVNRLKAAGNGIVPLCAAKAWLLLTQSD